MADKFDPTHAHKLENPERLVELPPADIVRLLALRGDETIVDYGAGTGLFTVPVAAALTDGRVLAVDEHPALLAYLEEKVASAGLPEGRVVPVPTADNSVPLPDGGADRVLMINVLHHVHDDPAAMAEVQRLLGPGGRLVVIDFAEMDRPVGPPNDHILSLEQVRAAVADLGLRELSVHLPGDVGRYQVAVVAEMPCDAPVAGGDGDAKATPPSAIGGAGLDTAAGA
ncbi:MAG: methyltransferase domain-containing protein [Thermoleophilia bacterium]|nr:methyltransferase domain-containing protein [Thermoleophilia bacterium]